MTSAVAIKYLSVISILLYTGINYLIPAAIVATVLSGNFPSNIIYNYAFGIPNDKFFGNFYSYSLIFL